MACRRGLTMRKLYVRLSDCLSVCASAKHTPLLHELHWLRVPERIKFRLCVLAYRCLHGTAPSYLAESLQLSTDVAARRRLRSAASPTLLVLSSCRSTLGDRSFPVAASRAWNSLPAAVRDTPSLLCFRRRCFNRHSTVNCQPSTFTAFQPQVTM